MRNINKKINHNDEIFLQRVIGFIIRGNTRCEDLESILGVTRQTIYSHLTSLGLSFSFLRDEYVRDPVNFLIRFNMNPNMKLISDPEKCSDQTDKQYINLSPLNSKNPGQKHLNTSGGSLHKKNGTPNPLIDSQKDPSGGVEAVGKDKVRVMDLVDRCPKPLQPILEMLIGDYKAATDIKEKTKIFEAILKYSKQFDPMVDGVDGGWKDKRYIRPELAPKQLYLMSEIDEHLITFVEGARRTRKTSTVFRWDFEHGMDLFNSGKLKSKTIFIAAQGGVTRTILDDMLDSQFHKDIKDWVKYRTAMRVEYYNGHELQSRNTVTSDVKGQDADVIIVDETDQVFLKTPKVIADLVATALTNNMKIVFMANRPEGKELGSFRNFTNIFTSPTFWMSEMKLSKEKAQGVLSKISYVTLEQSDIPEMQTEEFSEKRSLVGGIQAVCMSKEYADSQMGNKEPIQGVSFPQSKLQSGYDNYNWFINEILKSSKPEYKVLGIDPSGGDHPTGFSLWGLFKHNVFEIHSRQIEGEQNLDDDYIKATARDIALQNNVDLVVCESNSGGKKLVFWLKSCGINAVNDNIEGEESGHGHTDFIKVARTYMNNDKWFCNSQLIMKQLSAYRPHESKKTESKGDVADAGLLAINKLSERDVSNQRDMNNADNFGYSGSMGNSDDCIFM